MGNNAALSLRGRRYRVVEKVLLFSLFILVLLTGILQARGVSGYVSTASGSGSFNLVAGGVAATIYVDPNETPTVLRCVSDLANDIKNVTGVLPSIKKDTSGLSSYAIIVGTLRNSKVLQNLVSAGKIDVSQVTGQWETFLIQTVVNPLPGVSLGLVIAGSDRRGAVYGMYDVSENIGVSPWNWFADVAPMTQTNLYVNSGTYRKGPPSVKYRGIFINDEDWGIRPWSVNTFATADGQTGLGPTTYRRVFELMLRLKANHVWPAMHQGATPFNYYTANKFVADTFGIIMGSSHCEPMLRNVTAGTEWATEGTGAFNYETNKAAVYTFWENRIIANGMFENVYTLGKRGNDDSAMPEGSSTAAKVTILQSIFADQRTILKAHIDTNILNIPQVFIPYKEVLTVYNAGLVVPNDVTLMWVDDNHGYIRSLSNATERARSGGAGVYYHVSYWGNPADYLWLCSTPPALVWEEMNKAWEYKAKNVWVVNVGDIKPAEIETDLFLKMAWDMTQCSYDNVKNRLQQVLARDFGSDVAPEVADIMESYYRLGYSRKPEHMAFGTLSFSLDNYGDEAQLRLDAYVALEKRAALVYNGLPTNLQAAFYQMVLYPVRCAMYMNQKFLYTQKSIAYSTQQRANANTYGTKAQTAYANIQTATTYYNQTMSSGKWNRMMSYTPRSLAVFNMPTVGTYSGSGAANLKLYCEGASATTLPSFSGFNRNRYFIDLYSTGSGSIAWTTTRSASWIKLSQDTGTFTGDQRIFVTLDWDSVPKGTGISGTISFTGAGTTSSVTVPVFNPATPTRETVSGFVESNGYISMEAEHFTGRTDRQSAGWRVVGGLGRTGDAIMVLPTTLDSITTTTAIQNTSPLAEYAFYNFTTGTATATVYCIPSHRVGRSTGADSLMRYAIAVDNGTPLITKVNAAWDTNVVRAATVGKTTLTLSAAGQHTLKLWMVDQGLVVDKIVIDLGGVKTSYFGPPESFNTATSTRINGSVLPFAAAVTQAPSVICAGKKIYIDAQGTGDYEFSVFSLNGRMLMHERLHAGKQCKTAPSLARGIYLYVVANSTIRQTGRLVISNY